jgi:7,8-dihydroneopterin aldolase/epimerase/oxygenase
MDKIQLKGMRFYAYHGVGEQERKVGNTFLVDLIVEGDFSNACQSDQLSDAINYAELYDLVSKVMQVPCNLLEHLAENICNAIKQDFPQLQHVEITLTKQNPPIVGQMESASVILSR